MTPKEYCEKNKTIAIHFLLGGMEIKPIKLHTVPYMYFVAGTCQEKQTYHRCRVFYDQQGGFVVLCGEKIYLSEFIDV